MSYMGIKDIASCLEYTGSGPLVRYQGSRAVAIEYPDRGQVVSLENEGKDKVQTGNLDLDTMYEIKDL